MERSVEECLDKRHPDTRRVRLPPNLLTWTSVLYSRSCNGLLSVRRLTSFLAVLRQTSAKSSFTTAPIHWTTLGVGSSWEWRLGEMFEMRNVKLSRILRVREHTWPVREKLSLGKPSFSRYFCDSFLRDGKNCCGVGEVARRDLSGKMMFLGRKHFPAVVPWWFLGN